MSEIFQINNQEINAEDLVLGFVIDRKKDLEHDIYTANCTSCGQEFSVFVPKKERVAHKEDDEVLQEILKSKKCANCR